MESVSSSAHPRSFGIRLFGLFLVTCWLALPVVSLGQEDPDLGADSVALFNQGQDAHEKGDLAAAVKFYEQALAIVSEFPEAEYQLGSAFLALGRREDAEKSFRRALELRRDWTLALTALGSLLIRNEKFGEAEQLLGKAVELDGSNFAAVEALTRLRLETKAKPDILRAMLSRVTDLTAKVNADAPIWAAKAALERALGDAGAARASVRTALGFDPKNRIALLESFELALLEDDSNGARAFLTILERSAEDPDTIKFLNARLLVVDGKPEDAVRVIDSIGKPSPAAGALRDAIRAGASNDVAALERQLEKDPADAAVLGRLCSLLRVSDPARALDFCRRASASDPSNIGHAIGFGAALVQAKRFDEAVVLLRKLVAIVPENSTVHANLGTALFQLRRFEEAKAEYRWLADMQPELPAPYYFLAIVHDQLGEYLDAAANYNLFLKIADAEKNKTEIEKVKLRMPALQRDLKNVKGKKPS